MNVVIVGAGKASLILIDYFQRIDYIKLKGIIDVNENAPGVVRAKELGIATFNDISALNTAIPDAETIIEVTGNEKVKKMVIDQLKPHHHFMSSNAAKIMSDIIEMHNRRRSEVIEKVSVDFHNLTSRMNSSEEYIDQSIHKIEEVLRSMKIVTMNARIEAARAGENGKAFEVVVQEMQTTLTNIENALRDITTAADESKSTITELVETENKLKESLNLN